METLTHVLLYQYSPKSKKHERYDALVIGESEGAGDKPLLNLVYFDHLDTAAHHALSGIDYLDTLHRVLFAPHKDDVELQSFYWIHPHEENVVPTSLPSSEDLDAVAAEKQAKDQTAEKSEKPNGRKVKPVASGK